VEDLLLHAAGTQPHPLMRLTETAPPSEPASLFNGFLGGRLDVLTQDATAHPERYDNRTRAFLEELAGGARKLEELSSEEKGLLDSAVMDFAAFRPPKPAPAAKPQKEKKPALLRTENELLDERAPQVDMPSGPMTAYWWL
jgi:hypothetical protein